MRIYLDLETTGLSVWEDRITQIGAVATRDKQIISEFSTYVFTDRPIHPSAEKVTGISNETIKEAPPLILPICLAPNLWERSMASS